ncbi:MAG TPA: FAD-dependent oxidoreductase [Gaiellales bacterium]|jgi:dimethylamine/trimethylamine dehydrogenase
MREPRFDLLFEPVQIGPVTARNRFFQVPHCNGMGYRDPSAHARMRGVKAEGGWAVVCTEEVEIHPSAEVTPYIEGRIWDDRDIPMHERLCDEVHEHGSLAGIELCYNGIAASNRYSRIVPMAPSDLPVKWNDPVQARRMEASDIADVRRWHRQAVDRSLRAGYDIVYVYAGHNLSVLQHFLSRRYNDRTDEYGGSVENRTRLLREVLEDTAEVCEGRAGVVCRIAVDELIGERGLERGEIEEVLGLVGELPDCWDFMLGSWPDDSVTSRFQDEGGQEPYVRGLKRLTTKPVVGVGRFTSPDTMVRMIRDGVMDMIGAARPSIADPFLPVKLEQGRYEDIRECIGCNICVSGDFTMAPIRCTQNPSMGEEWRRGWHPERIRPKGSDARVLVVGAGPAGLEAAMMLGRRGYEVVLAEASAALGGRVASEARLPGLAAWIRVLDYRKAQVERMANVELAFESPLDAAEVASYGFDHVAVATGSRWRADGVGRWHTRPIALDPELETLTPDDVMAGSRPAGEHVAIFDDDHYYMGGVLAELLLREGRRVTLVTPASRVSEWTDHTMEQARIQARLLELGVQLELNASVVGGTAGGLQLVCAYTGRGRELECDALLTVTARLPQGALARDLEALGITSVRAVGDALAPGTIAQAVWDGRRYAEELDAPADDADAMPFLRETVELAPAASPAR